MTNARRNPRTGMTAQKTRLLRTKLFIPRAHPDLVARPRLVKRVDEGLKHKLLLVSAPPGFGKTTLLSTWINLHPSRVAWLSLDSQDNDPLRFWAYVVAALQTLQPNVGQVALHMLQSSQPPPLENILTELLNALAVTSEDFVLVLDDYHVIENQAIHETLAFLIDSLPPQMHMVLASRTDPPLPLPRWRARRELVELTPADLRFTDEEAAAFLNQVMGLDLSAQDVAALEKLTEGWIAGLQLAALSMQGLDDRTAFIRSFAGSHRYVFDYLAHEVLSRQPPEIRRFLLQTSILDRLSGSLCDALVERGGSQAVLEKLEQANLFLVPLDQQRRWYRYHHLFGDFLRAQLEQELDPSGLAQLRHRASVWYERNALPAQAVEQALAAREYERAAQLIKRCAEEMFGGNDLFTVLRWASMLPDAQVHADPELSMMLAWGLLATSQMDQVEPRLQDVERAIGVAADGSPESLACPANVRGALAEILCIRANLAFHHQDLPRVVALSNRAATYLTGDVDWGLFHPRRAFQGVVAFNLALAHEFSGDVPAATEAFNQTCALSEGGSNAQLIQIASSHLAQLQVIQGHLRRPAEIYEQALERENSQPSPLGGTLHTGLGHILYQWNDLERANSYFTRGVELGHRWSNWETLLPGYIGLAQIQAAEGNLAQATALLDKATELGQQSKAPWGASLIDAFRARVWTQQGNLPAVAQWAAKAQLAVEKEIPYLLEPETIILVQVLVALGRIDPALNLAKRLLASVEAGKRWGRGIEVLTIQALALEANGQAEAAMDSLSRALERAEPEGYIRVFLDHGAPLQLLLQRIKSRCTAQDYVARLLEAFEPELKNRDHSPKGGTGRKLEEAVPVGHPTPSLDALSEREREVLRLIASGMTNQEIAERLVLSLNTVKTHVKNIHAKLGARNRTEATARARELGLL